MKNKEKTQFEKDLEAKGLLDTPFTMRMYASLDKILNNLAIRSDNQETYNLIQWVINLIIVSVLGYLIWKTW